MDKRYERNMKTFSPAENEKIKGFRIFIAGCGGLGGYALEELGRLGVGHLTVVDNDVFEDTNFNRQILATDFTHGKSKVESARERMKLVNPEVQVATHHRKITEENAVDLIKGHDLVVDALDNIETRLVLEKACEKEEIPLVHGAIGGWYGQVAVIFPGDRVLEKLYGDQTEGGIEKELGTPAFTPPVVASIQVAEAMKVLLGRGDILRHKILSINLLEHEYMVIQTGDDML